MVQVAGLNSEEIKRLLQTAGGHYIIGEYLREGRKAIQSKRFLGQAGTRPSKSAWRSRRLSWKKAVNPGVALGWFAIPMKRGVTPSNELRSFRRLNAGLRS